MEGDAINHDRVLRACSEFDCISSGMAFFRQGLRYLLQDKPKLKFYEKMQDGELLELTIDEIFGTMDCIPEDLHVAYEWAKKNGYDPA